MDRTAGQEEDKESCRGAGEAFGMREEGQCIGSMGLKTGSEGSCMCRSLYEAKEMEREILEPTFSSPVSPSKASRHHPTGPASQYPAPPKRPPQENTDSPILLHARQGGPL